MKKSTTIITVTCDICGKDISETGRAVCNESTPIEVVQIVRDVYYAGNYYIEDLCAECNNAINDLIQDLSGHKNRFIGIKKR